MSVVVDYEVKIACLACIESYKEPSQRKRQLDWQFFLDKKNSDERIACYVAIGGLFRSAIIASRGTRVSNIEDLDADIKLATFQEHNSKMITLQTAILESKVKGYASAGIDIDNITLCGHSLGGALSVYAHAKQLETGCLLFNPGFPVSSLLPEDYSKFRRDLKSPNIQSYIVDGDPIAMPTKGLVKDQIIISGDPPPSNPLQAHSLAYLNTQLIPEMPLSIINPLYNARQRYNFS